VGILTLVGSRQSDGTGEKEFIRMVDKGIRLNKKTLSVGKRSRKRRRGGSYEERFKKLKVGKAQVEGQDRVG